MASAQDNTKTVCLDVGGTKFRVSRSLIEQYPNTMLARLISETWNNKPNEEIFIDRDGGLFQQVLHYMRDQKVHLPVSVSKAAVLHELHYFGFEDVSKDDIDVICANFDAIEHMRMLADDHDKRDKELNNLKYFGTLAYVCAEQYSRGNSTDINLHLKNITSKSRLPADVEFSKGLLNDSLVEYGLKCTKVNYFSCDIGSIRYGPRVNLSPL